MLFQTEMLKKKVLQDSAVTWSDNIHMEKRTCYDDVWIEPPEESDRSSKRRLRKYRPIKDAETEKYLRKMVNNAVLETGVGFRVPKNLVGKVISKSYKDLAKM